MSNLTTFFGGGSSSSGGSTVSSTITTYPRFKRLDFLNTATGITLNNGYIHGGPYVVGMNDTHFVCHYINNTSNYYVAKLFRVNDDYSVTGIGSWLQIVSSSPVDLDGIQAGNGYRSVYIASQSSSNSRIIKFDWDGGTGTSSTNKLNRAGALNNAINNCSCLVDGTLIGQLATTSSGGYIYYVSDSLTGTSSSGNYATGWGGNASQIGSIGMEGTINTFGIYGTSWARYFTLYRGNNGSLGLNEVDAAYNQSYVYNPNQARICRSGNRVVVAIQDTQNSRYGNNMLEGYGNGSTDGGSFQWSRANTGYSYSQGHGFADQDRKSTPCSDVEGGSLCRQYNGTYLDRGYIADFGEDSRFNVSYPFKHLQTQSSTADHDSAGGQCIIGDKLIQCHKFGTSNGSYSIEFDIWKVS